ncbi:MAG: CpXC domain-containing protein [Anaerolineales bacterium]|jgi:hypothetical protein
MPAKMTTFQCPQCKTPVPTRLEQIIDVSEDPGAKNRLLSNALNLVHCSVCGHAGQLAVPLVYHDAEKELLLAYIPVELGMKKDDQERALGQLINQVIDKLPAEQRKGYLLQPQTMLTRQSLIERILEADGITKEEIEAQRARVRLFEELLRIPEEGLQAFVAEHDAEMDEVFFQLASLSLRTTTDQAAREAASRRLESALALTSVGKRLRAREEALNAAAESLRQAGDPLTREKLIDIVLEAPDDDRLASLASLARPAMDYAFFQILTERIDAAEDDQRTRIEGIRQRLLEITQELDKIQEARVAQASSLLQSLIQAEDLDAALQSALPMLDDYFLGTLQASIHSAKQQENQEMLARLEGIDRRLREMIKQAMPPGLRLAQDLLEQEDPAQAEALLQQSSDHVDEQLLSALISAAERLNQGGDQEGADRIRDLHRKALRISMRHKMQSPQETPQAPKPEDAT